MKRSIFIRHAAIVLLVSVFMIFFGARGFRAVLPLIAIIGFVSAVIECFGKVRPRLMAAIYGSAATIFAVIEKLAEHGTTETAEAISLLSYSLAGLFFLYATIYIIGIWGFDKHPAYERL